MEMIANDKTSMTLGVIFGVVLHRYPDMSIEEILHASHTKLVRTLVSSFEELFQDHKLEFDESYEEESDSESESKGSPRPKKKRIGKSLAKALKRSIS